MIGSGRNREPSRSAAGEIAGGNTFVLLRTGACLEDFAHVAERTKFVIKSDRPKNVSGDSGHHVRFHANHGRGADVQVVVGRVNRQRPAHGMPGDDNSPWVHFLLRAQSRDGGCNIGAERFLRVLAEQLTVFSRPSPPPIKREHHKTVADEFKRERSRVFRRVVQRLGEHHSRPRPCRDGWKVDGHP